MFVPFNMFGICLHIQAGLGTLLIDMSYYKMNAIQMQYICLAV